ncbi:conserved hypothetical protein [Ricinus communis]|uniref:Uncharacterized protein n=1 Tax=Ricinus communis TaxID=3988 RepID=B9SSU7_RICCO|nr:conserved hypothetical protein [Ricinus communis]
MCSREENIGKYSSASQIQMNATWKHRMMGKWQSDEVIIFSAMLMQAGRMLPSLDQILSSNGIH